MSLKLLTQLSHFITMMFGIALGMTLCLLYQYKVKTFIDDLIPYILCFCGRRIIIGQKFLIFNRITL